MTDGRKPYALPRSRIPYKFLLTAFNGVLAFGCFEDDQVHYRIFHERGTSSKVATELNYGL